MPAAPLLIAAAVTTGTAATVGATVAAAVGISTVSAATATAVGAGIIAGGISAASGNDAGDTLKAAVTVGATTFIGAQVGSATRSALSSAPEVVSKTVSAAAAGGASNTLNALAQGATGAEAIRAGALGAAGAGAGELASIGAQQVIPVDNRVVQGGIAGVAGGAAQAAVTGQPVVPSAIASGVTTAGSTYLSDQAKADAAKKAQQDQVISAFMQPTSPGVGTQLGQPTAGLSGAFVPETPEDRKFTNVPQIDVPEVNIRPTIVSQDTLPEVIITAEKPSSISPVLPTVSPGRTTTAPRAGVATGGAGTATPSGTPTLSYVGPAQPEYGPPASGRQTPIAAPSGGAGGGGGGGGGGATAAGGGAVSGGGQPTRTDQILDLTGIRQPTTPRLPEVTVTGELTPSLPEVTVTGEEEIGRLPEVEVTGEEEIAKTPAQEDFIATQTFPLTPPSGNVTRDLIDFLFVGGGAKPYFLQPGQPGSSALAQALGVGDPGASYLGKKGKERKPVWNIESLKLKDELGGDYG